MLQPVANQHVFKKIKFTLLKYIYYQFKAPTKQILVFFQTRLWKFQFGKKSSAMWEPNFNINHIEWEHNFTDLATSEPSLTKIQVNQQIMLHEKDNCIILFV